MEKGKNNPQKIVDQMLKNDAFSKWLGIELIEISEGKCELQLIIREDMLNGFGIAHGGITYSLADSVLAFASNAHGRKSVSVETSISHTKPVFNGDVLRARANEKSLSNQFAIYEIVITNQKEVVVALFKGTVYRKNENWLEH